MPSVKWDDTHMVLGDTLTVFPGQSAWCVVDTPHRAVSITVMNCLLTPFTSSDRNPCSFSLHSECPQFGCSA